MSRQNKSNINNDIEEMNRNTLLGSLGLILLLMLIGVVSQESIDSNNLSESSSQGEKLVAAEVTTASTMEPQLVRANNRFGFKLFERLQGSEPAKNVFISPTSLAIALAMVRNGADGETLQSMTTALELEPLAPENISRSYQQLQQALQTANSDVNLAIANSLWANQEFDFQDQFIAESQEFYRAEVTNLDFTDPNAKNTINSWVEENTAGKIAEIVNSISPEDALFLINAIYFQANWTIPFDRSLTTDKPFYRTADNSIPLPMMSQTGEYRYYQQEQFQAVRIPYGDNKLAMYVFLPGEESNLTEFTTQLTAENWQNWLSSMRSQTGKIELPRFKLEYETEVKQALAALGMELIFDGERANFSRMTSQSVAIDRVKHKTLIEVNEKGTEAAGVTSIGIRATSAVPATPFEMNVNHPFFCAIVDEQTEAILFMGNIVDPS